MEESLLMDHAVVGGVLVVGGSRGFGAALAHRLKESSTAVTVVSRTPPCDDLRDCWYEGDVVSTGIVGVPPDVLAGVRHVVYSAGDASGVAPAYDLDIEAARHVFDVTCAGFMRVVQQTFPHLREHGSSSYLLIGSMAARQPFEYLSAYAAAKAAVECYAACLAKELQRWGIRVNTLGISGETDLAVAHRRAKEVLRGAISPHGELPPVEESVSPAMFLLSEAAEHVNGQTLEARSL